MLRLVDRFIKTSTNKSFGLSLSKVGISAGSAVRQVYRDSNDFVIK